MTVNTVTVERTKRQRNGRDECIDTYLSVNVIYSILFIGLKSNLLGQTSCNGASRPGEHEKIVEQESLQFFSTLNLK